MAVMKFKPNWLPLVSLLCLLIASTSARECDVNLMKHFHLSGSKFPVKIDMDICTHIEDNCCTPEDELRIYTLWNEFSVMKVGRFISQIFKKYATIMEAHQQIIDVNPDLIETRKTTIKSMPYTFKVCERTTLLEDLMDPSFSKLDLLNHNKVLDIPGFDARKFRRGDFQVKGALRRYASEGSGVSAGDVPRERKLKKVKRPQRNLENEQTSLSKSTKASQKRTNDSKRRPQKSLKGSRRLVIQSKPSTAPTSPDRQTALATPAPKYSDYQRKFVFDEDLPSRHVDCTTSTKLIHKEVTIENNFKKGYCSNLRTKIVNFRVDDFEDYIGQVRVMMLKVIGTKKSFYCSLCDNSLQRFVDSVTKSITFDQEFCRSLVFEYKDYLKFQNIVFVEYVDLIIQYIRCFQTTSEEKTFPYPNFLNTFKSQFAYIERCVSHIDSDNFMEHCVYVCDKYSYTGFSAFWDGNLDFLTKVMFLITSFIRKVKSNQPLTIDFSGIEEQMKILDEVDFDNPFYEKAHHKLKRELKASEIKSMESSDPLLAEKTPNSKKKKQLRKLAFEMRDRDIEAENESKMVHGKAMVEALKNLSKPSGDFREIEEKDNTSVYDLREAIPDIRDFQSKFVKDTKAIDPIFMERNMNFGTDSVEILEKKCNSEKKKYGELDQTVILEYFSFGTAEIDHFKTDLFLSFADYSLFQ